VRLLYVETPAWVGTPPRLVTCTLTASAHTDARLRTQSRAQTAAGYKPVAAEQSLSQSHGGALLVEAAASRLYPPPQLPPRAYTLPVPSHPLPCPHMHDSYLHSSRPHLGSGHRHTAKAKWHAPTLTLPHPFSPLHRLRLKWPPYGALCMYNLPSCRTSARMRASHDKTPAPRLQPAGL
jgi:hypothetical protein